MKRIFLFCLIALLSISLATAVSLEVTGDDILTIDIQGCVGNSILQIHKPDSVPPLPSTLVDISSGTGDWVHIYDTAASDVTGAYGISVSCADTTIASTSLCVDAPGCLDVDTPDDIPDETPGSPGSSSSNRQPVTCTDWDLCNASLEQSRTCTARYQNPRIEVQECAKCQESWICSEWSSCRNNKNYRTCVDEHQCTTAVTKPHLEKSCASVAGGFPPAGVNNQISPPVDEGFFSNLGTNDNTTETTLTKTLIIWGAVGLVVLILLIFLIVFLVKRKHSSDTNFDDLKKWVHDEAEMGASTEAIHQTLATTQWRPSEVQRAFQELGINAQ
ncbi:hypothetical protein HOI26_02195 [Candidatus Woesearchaeota archaeon]|nr:hypothetical protein [Candidatus Woesearchaeota archaeon]MBT5739888.1 hypothetical protein [Candidatus Woesearchaeota archaeon]